MSKLLLVRHGETELNSTQRYWGRTDVGLGPVGLRQAEQIRDRLAVEKIDYAYSSILRRAMVTAQVIASLRHLKVQACPELKEIDFGKVEGLNFEEVKVRFPEVSRMWIEHDPELSYPDGESLSHLEKRITDFRGILEKHTENETILIVAHSGVLRSLICQILKMENIHRWSLRLDLASLSIVETYQDAAILSLLNDTSHLTDQCR